MTNQYEMDDDYNFYFLIGIACHLILSVSVLMYGCCSKLPNEMKIKYVKILAIFEIVSVLVYCMLSPIFASSPPSIIILVMACYAVNVMYAIVIHEKYMADYTHIVLINDIAAQRRINDQEIEPIRTIETEIHLPEIAQTITCQYVQYTNTKPPIMIIQPNGNIMLGKIDTSSSSQNSISSS